MIDIEFDDETLKIIDHERKHSPFPKLRRVMEILWLRNLRKKYSEIAAMTGKSPAYAYACLKEYQAGGVDAIIKTYASTNSRHTNPVYESLIKQLKAMDDKLELICNKLKIKHE
jgi:hypothetical protein